MSTKHVKILQDVFQGNLTAEAAAFARKITGKVPPMKFAKDQVVLMTIGSAEKYVALKLGEVVEAPKPAAKPAA